MNPLTIVMYHYVRDLAHSRYPAIKALRTEHFRGQIEYLKLHYNPISAYDLMDAVSSGASLPPRPLLLTFDDAYIDHFTEAFPILDKAKMPGCFFPPARCILENRVLDVNKIHFVLASVSDKAVLADYVRERLDEYRASHQLESTDFYWQKCGVPSRYDSAEVMFIKHLLQRELPDELRTIITDALFTRFVSTDEATFSRELYMSVEQVACLQRNGMYVGSHGFDHRWLDSLPFDDQRREIDLSLEFLTTVGSSSDRWIMCYPYGAYNESLLSILRERNCTIGLTTRVGLADLSRDDPLTLRRLDTNDLPIDSQSAPNRWTVAAVEFSQ